MVINKNYSILNRLVAEIEVGFSQGDNWSANVSIGCCLANTEGRIGTWRNVKVNNLTITISKILGHTVKILS